MFFSLKSVPQGAVLREVQTISHLALPMMIAQVAQTATGFVDTVMAGRVSTHDLAAVSLGASVFMALYVTLSGVIIALNPVLAYQLGARQHIKFRRTAQQGLWLGVGVGMVGMILALLCRPILAQFIFLPEAMEEVITKAQLFITGIAVGMPAAMIHRALYAYASSLGHPKPIMVVSLCALAVNIPFNYILIHGLFGLPKMGGAGCGWATAIVLWFDAIVLFCYLSWHRNFRRYRLLGRWAWPCWQQQQTFFKLGLPIALSFFIEVSLFSSIALLIASLGPVVMATQQAVLSFSAMTYIIPQSIATALSVRVGHYVGAGDYQGARLASGIGLQLGIFISILVMSLVLIFRYSIMRFYTIDPQVVALGTDLLLFAALYQLTDAMQTIASGALRGYKLTTVPMVIHMVSFWGLGLGLGIVLGLTSWIVRPMGIHGFWLALVVSLGIAAWFLTWYLSYESRKLAERMLNRAVT